MKTRPVQAGAAIAIDGNALARAQHVFIGASALQARWAGRDSFAILETAFGLGHNFLATLAAWRADASRSRRLVYVAIEYHAPSRDELAQAHAGTELHALAMPLIAAWPALVPNLHALSFEQGRVQLLLGLGDVARLLPQIRARIDAFYLDGDVPAGYPEVLSQRVFKGLARLAAPGATVATWSDARALREHLVTAGFEIDASTDHPREPSLTLAHYTPHFAPRSRVPVSHMRAPQSVLVVGAGLAGAWTAHALAQRGVPVTVIDQHARPASEASGNLAGLYHATVHADDGPHAQLLRAAALFAHARMQPYIADAGVPGQREGVLRIETGRDALQSMQSLIRKQGLPADYVQALDAKQASARAGVTLAHAAWWFAHAGWVAPAALVRQLLAAPGIRFVGGMQAQSLRHDAAGWAVLGANGSVLGRASVLVLANAAGVNTLVSSVSHSGWPLQTYRGQVSVATSAGHLRLPVAGDGYVLPLADDAIVCGASSHPDDPHAALRDSDHAFNLERLLRLTGLAAHVATTTTTMPQGRVGWRVQVADRLPIVGALPAQVDRTTQRLDHARMVPRQPGLFVATALGGRGITLAPLLGELLAAQICGEPLPLGADLVDAIDPARWLVRQARRPEGLN